MPIAHAEGNYVCDDATFAELRRDDRIVFRYCDPQGNVTDEANVNGSRDNIAGICSKGRNVLGLMPILNAPAKTRSARVTGRRRISFFSRSARRCRVTLIESNFANSRPQMKRSFHS
jgi:phosphoribosylformylglycinamidine (FGAM) synthase-like amidotransferase family enzyme